MSWRLLTVAFVGVFAYAAFKARQNPDWLVVYTDRGFHFAFAVALIACLVVVRHYSIPVHPVYKALLGGFCFYSCTVVLANTVGRTLFPHEYARYQPIWQAVTTTSYAIVQVVWAIALIRPWRSDDDPDQHLPPSLYQNLSPEINQRLRELNDQLGRTWKLEAVRQ